MSKVAKFIRFGFGSPNFFARLLDYLLIIRLRPFDVSAPEGRSKERHRRVALATITSILSRGISALTIIISIPLTTKYLGSERYGLWMTISSVITLLGFADLGMGNGLVNSIAEADGNDDHIASSRYVSSGFYMLLAVAVSGMTIFSLVYPFIDWPRVFNVTTRSAAREAGPAMFVFVLTFALNLPLGVVQRVQLGYQEGYISNLWQSLGSILGLTGVLLGIYLKAGLPWLILAMAGAPLIPSGINWLIEFGYNRKWLLPRLSRFNLASGRKIISIGAIFLILQVFALIGGESIDNLVIAHLVNLSAVSTYAVTQRLFSLSLFIPLFLIPLWPAFGEALARKDLNWVRRTLRRSVFVSIAAGMMVSLPLILFGRSIIRIWAGPNLVPTFSLLISSGALVLMNSYKGPISTLFNSGPFLKRQVGFFICGSIASIALKIFFGSIWHTPGVIWGGILGYGLFYLLPMSAITREVLK